MLLSIGFVSLFRIRSSIRKSGGPDIPSIDIDKLEKLIIKIAIFSVLYTFPAALLIGAQFYESWWREEALKTQLCACDQQEVKFTETEVQVILLRYSMHLIPGIGAGIWICTPKVIYFVTHLFNFGNSWPVLVDKSGRLVDYEPL